VLRAGSRDFGAKLATRELTLAAETSPVLVALLPPFPRPSRRAGVYSVLSITLFEGYDSRRTGRRAPASYELSVPAARATLEVNTESGDEGGRYCPRGDFVITGVQRS
jgi:hypothetical protein